MSCLEIYKLFLKYYGSQYWWPVVNGEKCIYSEEFQKRERTADEKLEIFIGAILTQNTAWQNVIQALIRLKKSGSFSIQGLEKIEPTLLAKIIQPSGYYHQKAKKIKALIQFIGSYLKNDLEAMKKLDRETAREKLLSVWGIGPETADSILLYAYFMPAFVVDAYTRRIFTRIGMISSDDSYEAIQNAFERNLPSDYLVFQEYHALIVEHGKRLCKKKPLCDECLLEKKCLFAKQNTIFAHKCT